MADGRLEADSTFNAASYADYASNYPGPKSVVSKLADMLECVEVSTVLDLCAGTGAASREIVRRYPEAQVWAIDVSETMLAEARLTNEPLGVRHICAPAEKIANLGLPPMSAILCASAIWQTKIEVVLSGAANLLQTEGVVAFNIGQSFANTQSVTTTTNMILKRNLLGAAMRRGLVLPREVQVAQQERIDPVQLTQIAQAHGLRLVSEEWDTQYTSMDESRRWFTIPRYLPELPGLTLAERLSAVNEAFDAMPDGSEIATRWLYLSYCLD